MLKHTPLEPDAETAAKLFVTRHATNEPIGDAKPTVEITAPDGRTFEASEVKSDAAGSYSFKLRPLPEGSYTILARAKAAGKTDTATFSGVEVQHTHADSAEEGIASWARTVLMILAALVVLGLFGGLIRFALRVARNEPVRDEAVSV